MPSSGITAAKLGPDNIAGAKSVDLVIDLHPETATSFLLAVYTLFASTWLLRRYRTEVAITAAGVGTLLALGTLIYGSDALRVTRTTKKHHPMLPA